MTNKYFKWIFKPIIFQISKKSISMNLKKRDFYDFLVWVTVKMKWNKFPLISSTPCRDRESSGVYIYVYI